VTLVERHELEKKRRQGLAAMRRGRAVAAVVSAGAVLGSIGLLAFAGVAWAMLPQFATWQSLGAATLSWLALAVAAWFVRLRI
jgi:D-serine deaminase-like pyridoxal phosphate-dependent protein